MNYDIYGNPLRRGYCEVHPDVYGEYPCDVCISESNRSKQKQEYPRELELEHLLNQCSQEVADRGSHINMLDKRIAELENALRAVINDLRMRADTDSDGMKVLNISDGVLYKAQKALGESSDE